VAPNVEKGGALGCFTENVRWYEGYAFVRPVDHNSVYIEAVRELATALGFGGRVAIEKHTFPASLDFLVEGSQKFDVTPHLDRVRSIKTPGEIALLRRSAEAAAIGQQVCGRVVRPGISELHAFAEIRRAMEEFAGQRVPVTGDFLSGVERTARSTGWPNARIMEHGDPVLCDLAPRINGYWGDSCASFVIGTPNRRYEAMFKTCKSALNLAIDTLRPGVEINLFDQRIREYVKRSGFSYPHHTGHSIGTSVHEWPRIVPYERATFEEGMVVMVEPGAYDPEVGGVRTEWMIEITSNGCRPVFAFDHVMSI